MGSDHHLRRWCCLLACCSILLDRQVWILRGLPYLSPSLSLVCGICTSKSKFSTNPCFPRVNHWLVLITFLQHTDPLLPHYRASEFTFPRGALATYDRNLLGDLGPIMAWIGATCTHGISETHVAHHVHSKIPHYNAWEATDALRARLARAGINLQGRDAGWAEVYRVYKQCKVCSFPSLNRCPLY